MSQGAVPQAAAGFDRRTLLRTAAASGAMVVGFGALDGLVKAASAAPGASQVGLGEGGYGELRPLTRRDQVTGYQQELLLPEGFDFTIFGLAGTVMDDGHMTPLGHDGMAAFRGPNGSYRLVRNHEERSGAGSVTPSGNPADRYDQRGGGGTSTLQVRFDNGELTVERIWTSLAGTIVNCAGGPTPWGTWLSCEETTAGPGGGWQEPHGYVFEVAASANEPVAPRPLPALGRFVHEAVAVDRATGIVYLTEDRGTSGFYRFIPERRGDLTEGRLQMLKVVGVEGYDTRTGQEQGVGLPVEWVDIADPDPADAESNSLAVYQQGLAQGGATFARLEGAWAGNQAIYIVSTNGGEIGEGQIWEYRPHRSPLRGEGTLSLVYESFDRAVMSFPDNLTVSPHGSLLVCEDTSRSNPQLIGVTLDGGTFPFCVDPTTHSEWCGATFSHDGQVLFVNMQGSTSGDPANPSNPGMTIAIWGPWQRGVL
ncbi:DUF839 domain-containing protein [Natronosporangium hydrolyticum]|uniref:DUF839 domain-containing protein n=1 Tax=Natronosporangium hydrolyticum TaxID=2811111 RepID=A0A895YEJ2_9ACTN|nr:alkaline phosphatase PhoX [Natronosporangium hydrolyticum]QSB12640.1 DUF839 domain-containing protein [Natronosporangium hydrolyticum]